MNHNLMYNNLPVCPHCKEKVVDPDLYYLDLYGDEDVADIECGSCGEPVLIKTHVSYSYTTCPENLSDYYEYY